jgi:mitochondrial fission protein ELM1
LREAEVLPRTRVCVGAGHGTHLALIISARRAGARSVVLMKPSLPRSLFDLCIVPRHDGVQEGGNVLNSLGVLNRMRPDGARDPDQALILLGGPSRHHEWNDDLLLQQVIELVGSGDRFTWQAATSPRTPASTVDVLADIPGLRLWPYAETRPGWLPEQLARASRVWVTEDSVSMAYEAASCGATTGILPVPARGDRAGGRVRSAVNALLDSGHAVSFSDWQRGQVRKDAPAPLQEAERCARALLERWPDLA